jgi:hypothetical protein
MKVFRSVAALAAAGSLLTTGSLAIAASTPKGGKIRVFVINTSDTQSKILITGAIGDYGTSVSQDANGKVDPNGNFTKVTLKHGGFMINTTALNNTLDRTKPTINTTNCSVVVIGSASITLYDGTGAYTGISGKVVVTLTFAGLAPKTAKGCNLANGPTHGMYSAVTGIGRVSFK